MRTATVQGTSHGGRVVGSVGGEVMDDDVQSDGDTWSGGRLCYGEYLLFCFCFFFFFFQAEDGIRDLTVTGVQTCALPISGWGAGTARSLPPSPSAEEPSGCHVRTANANPRRGDQPLTVQPFFARISQIGRASCRERV